MRGGEGPLGLLATEAILSMDNMTVNLQRM